MPDVFYRVLNKDDDDDDDDDDGSSSDKWRLTLQPYNLKTYGFRVFSVIAPILWNDLPIDIRSIDDVNKFKCKLKTFLLKRVYELS